MMKWKTSLSDEPLLSSSLGAMQVLPADQNLILNIYYIIKPAKNAHIR